MDEKRAARFEKLKEQTFITQWVLSENERLNLLKESFNSYEPFSELFVNISIDSIQELFRFHFDSGLEPAFLLYGHKFILRKFEKTLKETKYSELTFDILQDGIVKFERFIQEVNNELTKKNQLRLSEHFGDTDFNAADLYLEKLIPKVQQQIETWKTTNETWLTNTSPASELKANKLRWNGSAGQLAELFLELNKKGYITPPQRGGAMNAAEYGRIIHSMFDTRDNEKLIDEKSMTQYMKPSAHRYSGKHPFDSIKHIKEV